MLKKTEKKNMIQCNQIIHKCNNLQQLKNQSLLLIFYKLVCSLSVLTVSAKKGRKKVSQQKGKIPLH